MSILVHPKSMVLCPGIPCTNGTFHTEQAIAYGTQMVAGVTPGKGGSRHIVLPVYDTVSEAREKTGADASVFYVPPPFAADAILEAIDAEIPLVVCIIESIPVTDMLRVRGALLVLQPRPVGPNVPGLLPPGRRRIAPMPGPDL